MMAWLRGIRERTKRLAGYADGYDNNFNLLRLIAAALVILGHSYFLTAQHGQEEPLQRLIGIDSGAFAVDIFFVISGFLVSKSYLKSRQVFPYVTARVLRIFPGLVTAVLFNAFVVGAVFTHLPRLTYLSGAETWRYILVNSTLISRFVQLEYSLPGVFAGNPVSQAVNGSLWTLPYEVWLYIALLAGGLLGVFKNRRVTNALFLGFIAANLTVALGLAPNPFLTLANFLRFATFFSWGVVFYVNREIIPVNGILAVGLLSLAALGWKAPAIQAFLFPLALAYAIFWLAYVPGGAIRAYNRLGDYSYGVYIYAFPVQQSLLALRPNLRPLQLLGLALPITLAFAALSWHFVEQPALRAKQKLKGFKLSGRKNTRGAAVPDQGKPT